MGIAASRLGLSSHTLTSWVLGLGYLRVWGVGFRAGLELGVEGLRLRVFAGTKSKPMLKRASGFGAHTRTIQARHVE